MQRAAAVPQTSSPERQERPPEAITLSEPVGQALGQGVHPDRTEPGAPAGRARGRLRRVGLETLLFAERSCGQDCRRGPWGMVLHQASTPTGCLGREQEGKEGDDQGPERARGHCRRFASLVLPGASASPPPTLPCSLSHWPLKQGPHRALYP